MMKLVQRLRQSVVVRNALLMYLVQISSFLLPLLAVPYLSRVLSTEHFGLVGYAQTIVFYFVTLTEYGFNLTASRSVAIASEKPEELSKIYSSVLVAKGFLTLAGFVIMLSMVLMVPSLQPHLILFLLAFTTVVGYMLFPLWLYQGLQKMGAIAVRDFAAKLISLVALIVLVRNDNDYLLAAAMPACGLVAAGVIGLFTVHMRLGVTFHWPPYSAVWAQLKLGRSVFISLAIVTYTAVTNTFVLGLYEPSGRELAYFLGAWRVISGLRSLVSPLSSAIYPYAVKKASHSERESLTFVGKYAIWFSAPFLLGGIVFLFGAPLFTKLILGSKYESSVIVMQILSLSPWIFAVEQVYSAYFMLACGYDKEWLRIITGTVIVNFVLLWPALHWLPGAIAVASTSMATGLCGIFMYWWFYRTRKTLAWAADATH